MSTRHDTAADPNGADRAEIAELSQRMTVLTRRIAARARLAATLPDADAITPEQQLTTQIEHALDADFCAPPARGRR